MVGIWSGWAADLVHDCDLIRAIQFVGADAESVAPCTESSQWLPFSFFRGPWSKRGIIRNWYEYINCSDAYGETGKFMEVRSPENTVYIPNKIQ